MNAQSVPAIRRVAIFYARFAPSIRIDEANRGIRRPPSGYMHETEVRPPRRCARRCAVCARKNGDGTRIVGVAIPAAGAARPKKRAIASIHRPG
ncbi:hypothetical protein KDW41_11560 [Burkholderia vietnamiensis]|nr:hypothetical protein [Burkholderia vietnamiensis]